MEPGEGFGYTLATGKLYCPIDEFHQRAEQLLGRPIWTHEFGQHDIWEQLRTIWEGEAVAALSPTEGGEQ